MPHQNRKPFSRSFYGKLILCLPFLFIAYRSFASRAMPTANDVALTPSTVAYLQSLSEPDYQEPIAHQRELREASAEALRLKHGQTAMASVTDVPAAGRLPLLRVFTPLTRQPGAPTILYAHGGGWVLSSVRTHDELCRAMATAAGATLVSVEYRLAPEHPYPAALEDMAEAYSWALQHGGGQGVALAGDSAGGNLVAGLALQLRDAPTQPQPAAMLLIYPALDSTCSMPSYARFTQGFGLSAEGMRHFWAAFLGGEDRLASAPVHASPLKAQSLGGLPPTLVAVAEADVLRDEGIRWHDRVNAEGGYSELQVALGQVHGFIKRPGNPEAAPFVEGVVKRLVVLAQTRGGSAK